MVLLREIGHGIDIRIPTEVQRHQWSRKFSVRNISPVPSDASAVVSRFAMMLCARELGLGARHKRDERGDEIPRALLAFGELETEGESARFLPTMETPDEVSTSMDSSDSGSSLPNGLQGLAGSSRTTIMMPGKPAYPFRVSFFDTHVPHTKHS
jgi:hypothetical protein